ncbi:MAG: hypothetical protein AAF628_34310 [Planctomycetota bacterium]
MSGHPYHMPNQATSHPSPSTTTRRRDLAAIALALLVGTGAARGQVPGSFVEDFTGRGLSGVERFTSPRWDIAVHVRDLQRWLTPESMLAAHGLGGSPPPATHLIQSYEDTVYTARQHLMTALNAESYGVVYLTPNALADFRTGECIIRFDLSTLRTTRRDWIDLWLTPFGDNMQLPLEEDLPDLQGHVRNGLQIRMQTYNAQIPGTSSVDWTHFEAVRYDGYETTKLPAYLDGYESFLVPSPKQRETFELRISRTSLKFGMPAYGLWWIDTTFADLGYDRAVVQFGHHSYNPVKVGGAAPIGHDPALAGTGDPSPMSWHWDDFAITPALRFDVIHADRRFVLGSAPQPVVFERPAPAGSFVRFSALGDPQIAFDGGPFQPATRQDGSLEAAGEHAFDHFSSYWMPIPAGTQQIDLQLPGEGYWASQGLETLAKDFAIWSLPVGGVGCPGSGGRVPAASHPTPALGSRTFELSLTNALPGAPAALVVSLAEVEASRCAPAVALMPTSPVQLLAIVTDPTGNATVAAPLPASPALTGTAVFAQWAVADPAGGFSGWGLPLALSPLRRIVLQ